MRAYFAMAVAVYMLSPVTILTVMPAFLQFITAYGIESFNGSLMPASPNIIKPDYSFYGSEVVASSSLSYL